MNISNMPIEILIKFQMPPNVNKFFDTIFYEIKESNSKKIDLIIQEIKELNSLTNIKVNMSICLDIRFWNLNQINFKNLNLSYNNISLLPQSFGNIFVNGNLDLSHNKLIELPINFENIIVEGDLDLSYNELKSLPQNFLNIKNNGDINLTNNKLESLPNNFIKFLKYYNWKIFQRVNNINL